MKRYGEALESFDRAVKLSPAKGEVWNLRGVCLYNLKRYDEALDSFESAIKADPSLVAAWRNKGSLLLQKGRKKEGKKCVDHARKLVG